MQTVNIKGPIISSDEKWIYDWFGIEATCALDVQKVLKNANGEELEVIINSPGGYVDDGSEIYTLLKDYKGKTTGKIVGIAASAASVAAMGVDTLKISPTARIMIHNASGIIQGDYRDMEHGSDVLKECNKAISNAYMLKTGMKQEDLLNLMNRETFMNAQRAKELGFVDEIMFDTDNKLININDNFTLLPNEVINKVRNLLDDKSQLSNLGIIKNNDPINRITTVVNATIDNKLNNQEGETMDLETLKNEHKEIYNQIVNDAISGERARIKEIENLAIPGNEEIINKAKFETGISAQEVAIEIIKAEKAKGINYLANRQADISNSNINDVKNTAMLSTSNEEKQQIINSLANLINSQRRF